MATLTADAVRDELKDIEKRAAASYAKATELRNAMVAEGVDPLKDKDAFAKVDDAFKEYDTLASQASDARVVLDRLSQMDGYGARQPQTPAGTLDRAADITSRRMGQRLIASEAYQRFKTMGATDATFGTALMRAFERPVEIMSKAELEAAMGFIKYGATTVTGGSATSAGPMIQNDLQPGFVNYIRKTPSLATIVGQGTTDSDTVEYVTQTAVTNAAAETNEDTAATEATYAFATATVLVQEITHFVPVTLRAMADEGQLRTIIEGELAIDVLDRLDTQMASGNGTPPNLEGIYSVSGLGTQALGGDTRLDALHKAMTQIRSAAGVLMEADYIGMHPTDWQNVRLAKDANDNYLLGPAGMTGERQIWGVPVIVSTVFTAGSPLVGNFDRGSKFWLREGLSVTAGLDGNDFTKRRISLLAAMRGAFKAVRPTAFCSVTGF